MRNLLRMRLLFLFIPLLLGCGKFELISIEGQGDEDESFYEMFDDFNVFSDSLHFIESNDVLERAYRMATLEWSPIKPVPRNGARVFPEGQIVTGIPYSSVKEINTYLFQDVSYHTFMTAVHNPNSVLYTENISKAPYHGTNCASYYGAVCSSSVMCALGISIPYYTSQIIELPSMERIEHQVIDSLRVCDVIWKSGHVQMIFQVDNRSDTLYQISTFESSGRSAHINHYSKEQFKKMWEDNGYVGYRYKYLVYSEVAREFRGFNTITYNEDLCPSKGDRSVYRTTDTVAIDIFNPNFDKIVLKKMNSTLFSSEEYSGGIHKYHDLRPGVYSVYLQNNEEKTAEVSFEIIEAEVSYSFSDDGKSIDVCFQSSAKPEYVALCDLAGNSSYYPISSYDRELGRIAVPRANSAEYYCKVVFRGEYGRIINNPIRVN